MRITRRSDNLWARILDIVPALEGRAFDTHGEITFTIDDDRMCPHNAGTWQLSTDATGGELTSVSRRPDLVIDVRALGSLYLGGLSASDLANAGLIHERTGGAVAKLGRMFHTDPEPHNSFGV